MKTLEVVLNGHLQPCAEILEAFCGCAWTAKSSKELKIERSICSQVLELPSASHGGVVRAGCLESFRFFGASVMVMVALHRFNQGRAPRNSASSTRYPSACQHPRNSPKNQATSKLKLVLQTKARCQDEKLCSHVRLGFYHRRAWVLQPSSATHDTVHLCIHIGSCSTTYTSD